MSEGSSIRRRLPAGIVDTAFSSLSTFVVGFTAVVRFDDVDRGAYALFFAAYLMGELVANEWVFTPSEVESISTPTAGRLSLLPRSLILGLGPCLVGSTASLIALGLVWSYTPAAVAVGLAATSAPLIVLSPMQNHIRRMLHIAARSSVAAVMSVVQFGVALGAVLMGTWVDLPLAWLPFGALVSANVASILIGVWIVRHPMRQPAPRRLEFRELSVRGLWFVINGAASAIAGFAVAVVISWLASPEDLGYAESARIVAQPILVFATGLTAVLGPRVMEAGLGRDGMLSRSANRVYSVMLFGAGGGYLILVGWDWDWSPVPDIVPSAYVLTGLVALTVVANVVVAAMFLQLHELAGAGRERLLAAIGWIASVPMVGGGLTAGFTGAYARSIGLALAGSMRYILQRRALRGVYRGSDVDQPKPALLGRWFKR